MQEEFESLSRMFAVGSRMNDLLCNNITKEDEVISIVGAMLDCWSLKNEIDPMTVAKHLYDKMAEVNMEDKEE